MSSVQAELILFVIAGHMLCGNILGRSFTPAFEQMRLDNTASIACGTFVQIRTQIHRPSMHPYRHMSGISVSKK